MNWNTSSIIVLKVVFAVALTHAQETTHSLLAHDDPISDMLTTISSQMYALMKKQQGQEQAMAAIERQCKGTTPVCRLNWAEINRNCYFIPPVKRRWQEASDYCRTEYPGAELAVMEYINEFYEVKKVFFEAYQSNALFVGAKKRGSNFYWQRCDENTDVCMYEEAVQPEFWRPGQPNNLGSNEGYVALYWPEKHPLLNDHHDIELFFLCKYKLA